MHFTTIGLLIFNETDDNDTIQTCFSSLIQKLSSIGFNLETIQLRSNQDNDVKKVLCDTVNRKDIVITWGCLKKKRSCFFEIVCDLFKQNIVHNIKLEEYLHTINLKHCTEDLYIPKHGKFIPSHENSYPIIYLHRLYMIDEGTSLLKAYDSLIHHLENYRKVPIFTKVYRINLNSNVDEFINKISKIKNGLNVTSQKEASFINLNLSSNDIDELNFIQNDLYKSCGNFIEEYNFYDNYEEGIFLTEDENIRAAINCIEECFRIYSPENVFISFNGGKDCTVLLHMMSAVLKKKYPDYKEPIYCMYVRSDNPFPEVDDFIDTMKDYYNLNIITISSGIKSALAKILEDKPNLKACLLGTRRMDPFSDNLEHFKKTDNGWPDVMRVSPLLDWDYVNIWDYLIDFKVPYCCLYDHGYTSLGNTNNTIKNPELKYEDCKTKLDFYLPAHKLFDGTKERQGRDH